MCQGLFLVVYTYLILQPPYKVLNSVVVKNVDKRTRQPSF